MLQFKRMPTHRLKLFRRHTKNCLKGYPKDFRIVESDSKKATEKAQCRCTIVAQGTLSSGKFLKHPSTGENVWAEAHKVADLWWEWGDMNPPAEVVRELKDEQNAKATTIVDAAAEFLSVKKAENVSLGIVSDHRILLQSRLVPFGKANGYEYIQQMDKPTPWSQFRQSWVNLNPLHNRKPESGIMTKPQPVAPRTAKRLLGQTREFIRFCIGRKWLTEEWAAPKYLKVSAKIEPKEPFSDEDIDAILDGTRFVTDRGKTGQQNAKQLLVFCYVLRHSGLRISDATKLEKENLVPRPGDPENYSLHVFQKKTQKWVFIPIPSGDIPGEPDVAAALLSLPLQRGKYFFMGGKFVLESNKKSWYARLSDLFRFVEQHEHELSVHPHPHRFRHTFAARMLEKGADIRDVAEWLGDTVAVVLKHYAKFTTKQQTIAAQRWKEVMLQGAKQRRKLGVVRGGKKV
jgi:site-specific recombinase XerD